MEESVKKSPIKIFSCGPIKVAIWLNSIEKDGTIVDIHSVKINKSYRDKNNGEWKRTNSFSVEDLPKIALVAKEAYKYVRIRTFEPEMERYGNNGEQQSEQNDGLATR